MMAQRGLLSLLLSLALASPVLAQGVNPVHPVKPNGTALFPSAFTSADNIAAQTATAIHGLTYIWDGANWDRWTGSVTIGGTLPAFTSTPTFNVGTTGGLALDTSVDGLEGGVGTAADAAATAGSTGSLSAKLRLITSQLDAISTELAQKTEPANTQTISGSVTLGAALPAGTNNIGDVDVASIAAGDNNIGNVDIVTMPNVTIGTFPDNEPFNVAQVGGTAVGAHDGTTFEAPLTHAAYAESAEDSDANTNGNRVSADGDKVRLLADRNGTLYVRNGPPHRWAYHENSSSALTDTTVHASCGTGLFNYIESITFSIGGATAASVLIEDSTTATILGPYYLEAIAGRGLHVTYPGGRKQTNSATLISVTTTGAVAHGLDIIGFCAP